MFKIKAFVYALLGAPLFTVLIAWLFDIQPIALERWSDFPEKWSVRELVTQAFLMLFFVGSARAIYKGYLEYTGKDESRDDGKAQSGD